MSMRPFRRSGRLAKVTLAVTSLVLLAASSTWAEPGGAVTTSPVRFRSLGEPGVGGWVTDVEISPHDPKRLLVAGDMLGVGFSTDGGDTWQGSVGFRSWEMASFTFHPTDPNTVWVGSMSGPYVSQDGGATWEERRSGMPPAEGHARTVPIELVIYDPSDPQHRRLLAIGGSSRSWEAPPEIAWGVIWQSDDAGATWTQRSRVAFPDGRGVNLTWAAFVPGDAPGGAPLLYATGRDWGFAVSRDSGKTWERRNSGLPNGAYFGRVAVHPKDPKTLWIAMGNRSEGGKRQAGGIYKSTDGGLTWAESSEGLRKQVVDADPPFLTTHFNSVAVAASDPRVLYTNDAAWTTGVTYRSTDGGATWVPVMAKGNVGQDSPAWLREVPHLDTACLAGNSQSGIVIDPADANRVLLYGSEFISRTRDGGATWDDASSYRPDPTSRPETWRGRGYTGWCSTNIAFDPFHPGRIILQAMDCAQAWVSEDNGASWTYHHTPVTAWSGGTAASFAKDATVFVATGPHGWQGVGRSRDGGRTWNWLAGPDHGLPEPSWGRNRPSGILVDPLDSKRVMMVLDHQLVTSTDGGEHWSSGLRAKGLNWIASRRERSSTVYLSSDEGVFATDDWGRTLRNIGGPRGGAGDAGRLAIDTRGRLLFAAHQGDRPGIWRYDPSSVRDDHNGWTRLLDERWVYGVDVDPSDPDRIAVSTNQNPYSDASQATGAWLSCDGGVSWSNERSGLPMLRAWCVAIDPHDPERLIYGTFGRGFFEARWPRTYHPTDASFRRYAHNLDDTVAAQAPLPGRHVLRDFGPANFDYAYEGWKLGENVKNATPGVVTLDVTERGGAGVVLNGAPLRPDSQTHLALRLRPLQGNAADAILVNVIFRGGQTRTYRFSLAGLSADKMSDVLVPFGDLPDAPAEQVQVQGADFSPSAKVLKLELDALYVVKPKP